MENPTLEKVRSLLVCDGSGSRSLLGDPDFQAGYKDAKEGRRFHMKNEAYNLGYRRGRIGVLAHRRAEGGHFTDSDCCQ